VGVNGRKKVTDKQKNGAAAEEDGAPCGADEDVC
jgi:hypothetical protein